MVGLKEAPLPDTSLRASYQIGPSGGLLRKTPKDSTAAGTGNRVDTP